MRKFLAVITREFRERVRTRAFVISTILIPLFLYPDDRRADRAARPGGPGPGASPWWTRPRLVRRAGRGGAPGCQSSDPVPRAAQKYRVERISAAPGRIDAVKDSLIPLTGKREEVPGKIDGFLLVTEDALASGAIPLLRRNVGSLSEMDNAAEHASTGRAHREIGAGGRGRRGRPGGIGAGRTCHLEDHRREAHRGERENPRSSSCMS